MNVHGTACFTIFEFSWSQLSVQFECSQLLVSNLLYVSDAKMFAKISELLVRNILLVAAFVDPVGAVEIHLVGEHSTQLHQQSRLEHPEHEHLLSIKIILKTILQKTQHPYCGAAVGFLGLWRAADKKMNLMQIIVWIKTKQFNLNYEKDQIIFFTNKGPERKIIC